MEHGYGKERQFDGYPFNPSGKERERFVRCVRNALVEFVLDGMQSIVRFGDGRRFTFPVPHGDELLKHVEIADVIAVQGGRKSINVTVCFPCKVPNAHWASDEFTATFRVEFMSAEWETPSEKRASRDAHEVDWSQFRDPEVPLRHYERNPESRLSDTQNTVRIQVAAVIGIAAATLVGIALMHNGDRIRALWNDDATEQTQPDQQERPRMQLPVTPFD